VRTRNLSEADSRAEAGAVIAWRRRQLAEAGFDAALAVSLAHDFAYDLHALIELVERGCPPHLAVRILAPIDDGGDAA
jgi:hypothetical protein